MQRSKNNSQGAAIISVLVVLALCTMVVSGLFAKEYVTIRSVENRAALSQIRWMERAVLDWVQVALRFDANNDARANKISDECSEPWSVFIDRETQLDETTTGGIALSTADSGSRASAFSQQRRVCTRESVLFGRRSCCSPCIQRFHASTLVVVV